MAIPENTLALAGYQIPIESAVLTGVIPDPNWCDQFNEGQGKELGWTLEIVTMMDPNIDDRPYAPILTTGSLACPTRYWRDFEGTEFSWSQPRHDESGEYHGTLHMDAHDVIKRATIKFFSRTENQFHIQWSGVSDIQWAEPQEKDVKFSLTTTATFAGIIVSGSAEESLATFRERLDRYLDAGDFEQSDIQLAAEEMKTGLKKLVPWKLSRAYRAASCSFRPK
ncbi:MAG: hypothetical protein AAGL69_14955 [Pseudomonadota bacterium]